MKTFIIVPVILFLYSCQKDYTPNISAVNEDNAEVSSDDIVTFDDYTPGSLSDNGSGKVVCSFWTFAIEGNNIDSAYPKRFSAVIHKDAGVQVGQLIMFIDGERIKTAVNPETDTVHLDIRSPLGKGIAILYPFSLKGSHTLTFRLVPPDGVTNTGSYHVDLVEAAFLNKNDDPQTWYQITGLPVIGDMCTYR